VQWQVAMSLTKEKLSNLTVYDSILTSTNDLT
jgi:hypothetical protein